MKKFVPWFAAVAVLGAGIASLPSASFADTATATTTASAAVQADLNLIASLQQQIQALMQQVQGLRQQVASTTASLVQSLSLGSQGDQVKVLQAALAAEPGVYPEGLVTGYFGPLTEAAVKRFQEDNGLPRVGVVGPETRGKLNGLLREHPLEFENETSTTVMRTDGEGGNEHEGANANVGASAEGESEGHGHRLCAIVPPGHLIAPGWLREKGDNEVPVVPACQTLPPGIEGILNGTSTAPTSTATSSVSLSVSDVGYSVSTDTATVSWTTNEAATGEVYYGIATPLDLSATSTANVSTSTLSTGHSLGITGLNASTTYYFVVKSADASGNVATSSEDSFTTGS